MIGNWMKGAKLQIAHHKTEVLLVSNCKAVQRAEITVGEHTIASKRVLKYLGVMIDDRLNFNSHVEYACEKASKAINAIARIMPNNAGPSSSKRRLLASVSSSILRYGGPAWVPALETKQNQRKLSSTFRLMAMRVVSAYRTISSEAVCVIAGMIPIGITLAEDSECYRQREAGRVRKVVRVESLAKWQQEWNTTENGRWTHRLIPILSTWVNRKHGEVNFHLTQFLSGHGCFRKYLHRFGHAASPLCPECGNVDETPEHVVFDCPRFEAVRTEMPVLNVERVKIVGFADDVVLTVTSETLEEVEVLSTKAIDMIGNWMQGAKLQIAHHKTEVHVEYACEKASKAINAKTRIMPNNAGPSSSKRRLLASVSSSILRYGGPVWVPALETKQNQRKLSSWKAEARWIGLTINASKTKYMRRRGSRDDNVSLSPRVHIDGDEIEVVDEFTYLGSLVTVENDTSKHIERRIMAENRAYFELRRMLRSIKIRRCTKLTIYKMLIRPVVLYTHETCTMLVVFSNGRCYVPSTVECRWMTERGGGK
ncbi:uncharacterized protein LOC135712450 [Ochlerotatus camptorhynchus]|uniref:uncharacterized protein LOC135712450 n=1 Tax=Ochlerotatus camptorhynchus TaxID=644619 RepID=UPI0031E25F6A